MRKSTKSVLSARAAGLGGVAVLAVLVTGWSGVQAGEQPQVADVPSAAVVPVSEYGEFAIPAGMLDTWNAVGQVLVRLDGVTYEGRAQMLGLYAVQYQGERFLILTKARVLESPDDDELTFVSARLQSGGPNRGTPAVELMGRLEQQLPMELARIAAGVAGPQTAGLNPP